MYLKNLKAIRKNNKMTQFETAKIFNIPLRTYNAYENGEYQPSLETLIKLADYFEVSVDYLIGHRQNNKIDLSGLSKAQRNAINIICELNELNSNKVEAYAQALLSEQK